MSQRQRTGTGRYPGVKNREKTRRRNQWCTDIEQGRERERGERAKQGSRERKRSGKGEAKKARRGAKRRGAERRGRHKCARTRRRESKSPGRALWGWINTTPPRNRDGATGIHRTPASQLCVFRLAALPQPSASLPLTASSPFQPQGATPCHPLHASRGGRGAPRGTGRLERVAN